jgi:hypothetical protein
VLQGKEEPFPLLTRVIAAGPCAPGQRGTLPCLARPPSGPFKLTYVMGRDGGQIERGVQRSVGIRIIPAAARASSPLHAWGWAKQLGNDAACPPPRTLPMAVGRLRAR